VHYAAGDPWVEAQEEVAPLGAAFEEHVYPGSGHLFADPDLPDYDRGSSEAMWGGCSPSSIGSTPDDRASKARPVSHTTTFLMDDALPA
jgi:hypothetical protein